MDDRTVRLRPTSSGTAPSPTRLTADGDRSAATLGLRVENISAESRGEAPTALTSTRLAADGALSVVRVAMFDAEPEAEAALGSIGRPPIGRAARMSLFDRALGRERAGGGFPGMTPRRGGADAAVARLVDD